MPTILIAESLHEETLRLMCDHHDSCVLVTDSDLSDDNDARRIILHYQPDISVLQMQEQIARYDALIVRPKLVPASVIEASERLALIIRGGAGVNSIDLDAAKQKNIVVENTPGLNSIATAEYSFALMMDRVCQRQIQPAYNDVLLGTMHDPEHYSGFELRGRSIALVGLGHIGQAMAKRCEAFDMTVWGYNRSVKEGMFEYVDSLDALLDKQADIISLHVPLTPETHHIINDDVFHRMKPGSILINTARPQLMCPDGFGKALESKILVSAAIDGDYDVIEPFVRADQAKQCLFTHHIADATMEAQRDITKQIMRQIQAFFLENKVINQC